MYTLQFIKKHGFGRECYYPDCDRSRELLTLKPRRKCFNKSDILNLEKDYKIVITHTLSMGNGKYNEKG